MIGGYPFRMVGVLAERGSTFGESMDNQIFVPLGALFRCFGRHRSIDIGVRVISADDVADGQRRGDPVLDGATSSRCGTR